MLFDIFINCKFHHAKLANDQMAFHASTASLNKSIKKEDILSINEK
jgi:hypothetical protein